MPNHNAEINELKIKAKSILEESEIVGISYIQSIFMCGTLLALLLTDVLVPQETPDSPDKNTFIESGYYGYSVVMIPILFILVGAAASFYFDSWNSNNYILEESMGLHLDVEEPNIERAKSAIQHAEESLTLSRNFALHLNIYKGACFAATAIASSKLFAPGYTALVITATLATEIPIAIWQLKKSNR
jgi:hypothetical protein